VRAPPVTEPHEPAAAPAVLITNCVALNGGDAAILYAVIDRLRAALGPDLGITVVDDQPEDVGRRYPELSTTPRLDTTIRRAPAAPILRRVVTEIERTRVLAGAWCMGRRMSWLSRLWLSSRQRSALEVFRHSTAVVSTGGTYLVERYPIAGRLLELEAALAMGRPLILFTQSLGPFTDPRNQRVMRRVASGARLVLLRDERSRRELTALGVPEERLHVVADAAFALSTRHGRRSSTRLRIAVSVRNWPYAAGDVEETNDRYRSAIVALVESLVRNRDAEVTFLSTCQGAPEYWTDDSSVAVAIADRVDPALRTSVHVDRDFRTPQELLDTLGGFDVVVATRMHMAILALVSGVPVFPIAYEPKTRELFERLEMGHWVRDFEKLSAVGLAEDVERFIDDLPAISPRLWPAVESERRSAIGSASLVARALEPERIGGNGP
jgi:colanic acid/amylovoran biosynthesis protein